MPSNSKRDRTDRAGIALLKEDHAQVKKAFAEFEKLHERGDEEACAAIVHRTCAALKAHSELEEELFYPAVRELLDDAQDILDEAEVEHATFKQLIQQLESFDMDDPKHAATFTVLGEYVKHHIKEEETEMFPRMERAHADWGALSEAMRDQHDALQREHGLEGEALASKSPPPRSRPSTRSAGPRHESPRPQAAGSSDEDEPD